MRVTSLRIYFKDFAYHGAKGARASTAITPIAFQWRHLLRAGRPEPVLRNPNPNNHLHLLGYLADLIVALDYTTGRPQANPHQARRFPQSRWRISKKHI